MDSKPKQWLFLHGAATSLEHCSVSIMLDESLLQPLPQECCLLHHTFLNFLLVRQQPTSVLLAGLKRINLSSVVVPRPCWNFPMASWHTSSSAHASLQQENEIQAVTAPVLQHALSCPDSPPELSLLSFQLYPA